MWLKWLRHNGPKRSASTHATGETSDDTESSSIRPSGTFSSTAFSFESNRSSSRSLSVKDILPRRPRLYNYSEITAATHKSSSSRLIGTSAWKGVLRGSLVAIFQKPGEPENFSKLLRYMNSLHHSSLVKVVGGCTTAHSVFVVYEFVHGVDLQSCLCNTLAPGYTALSTWKLRMQVAVDVAKGLEYIHQHISSHSAHKYLTSSNITLTNDSFRAKLALVGMSILTGEVSFGEHVSDFGYNVVGSQSNQHEADAARREKKLVSSRSIKIKGARGYIPPEYAYDHAVSPKYDVFTFGIVLLELLKGESVGREGRPNLRKASIVDDARLMFSDESVDRKMLRLWIDGRLQDSYPVDDAVKVIRLALSCLDEAPDKRPTMENVALHMAIILNLAEVWEKKWKAFTGTGTLVGR